MSVEDLFAQGTAAFLSAVVTKITDTIGPTSFGSANRQKRVEYTIPGQQPTYVDVPFPGTSPDDLAKLIYQHAMAVEMLAGQREVIS